jgi:hypothetical protein
MNESLASLNTALSKCTDLQELNEHSLLKRFRETVKEDNDFPAKGVSVSQREMYLRMKLREMNSRFEDRISRLEEKMTDNSAQISSELKDHEERLRKMERETLPGFGSCLEALKTSLA